MTSNIVVTLSDKISVYRCMNLEILTGKPSYTNVLWREYISTDGHLPTCQGNESLFLPLRINNMDSTSLWSGPGSSVGIATELRAGWSRIESRQGRDFPSVQTGPGAHPASCKMGTGSFSGVKCGRGVLLTIHPLLVPRSWKCRAIPLHTLWATPGL